ncbi:hypothetical protein NP554_21870 [Pseudomonas asiatica]|uniref:Uncharacterized protein n=1 Tax=Pseudomonas asiatica TaxID=2219225 RepID=A0A9X4D2X3_9PSED|nr:hypothetical protein [Pseudomonas asiatica]MDD2108734.1 hypothetical protein [Pseudomonas asiatica]MDD2114434.1 hypothetical protein [Pseudomonas asiatica]
MSISLREAFLDAILDGTLGKGLLVTRQEVIALFPGFSENYKKVFLSNSEMSTATHSPTYKKFTQRVSDGIYRVHPQVLVERLSEREQQLAG